MGATYTRQSSSGIVDGGVIEATDLNNEFDQLLAAFAVSSGHTHDGTAAEGGPITKLLGTAITIGDGTSGTDIAVTFDGESADGVLTWMEDEDYFKFSDEVLMNSTEKLMFQDTGTYIYSNADGDLDVVSDGTAIDSINLESAGGITLDAGSTTHGITYEDDGTPMLQITNSSSDVVIKALVDAKDILFQQYDGRTLLDINDGGYVAIANGSTGPGQLRLYEDTDNGTNYTAFQVGTQSGDITYTLPTADGSSGQQLTTNGSGTLSWAASSAATAADDISTGDAAVTLATSSGNITIDAQAGDADIIFKGTDSSSDITALTLDMSAAGAATFNDKIIATELDISGDVDIDGTLEADAITVDGTALATYIRDTVGTNMVSSNTESGITVTYDTTNDNIDFAIDAAQTGITSLLATDIKIGEDDQTKIDFEDADKINFYAGNEKQLILEDGALYPGSDNIIDLGKSDNEFKDAFFDGTVTADAFAGPLTGNVTGNASGTAATVTGAAQSNITSLGTLTTLTVDNVIINGSTIGHTGDTDLMTVASGVLTVAGEVSMTTLDIGGTNVTATAAELNYSDGVTSAIQTQLDTKASTGKAIAMAMVFG